MEFSNRKAKCKKIQITDENGLSLPESFYALITDEVTEAGTPLNAENMNKGNWRDDTTISFMSNDSNVTIQPEANITKIYTDENGETWLLPPSAMIEKYKLNSGQKALNNLSKLYDPTSGKINSLQEIVCNLISFVTGSLTAEEYDNLADPLSARPITADVYDIQISISALDYDMYGKKLII